LASAIGDLVASVKYMDHISTMQDLHDAFGSLDLLVDLDLVLTLANVTRAAERRGLSQPAMSRILARLRAEFGDPLLVRVGSRWELTPRAIELRTPVRNVLREARALYSVDVFSPESAVQTFRVAIPDVIGAALLPALHLAFAKSAPLCTLAVIPWPGDAMGMVDVDLAIGTETRSFPAFRMEPLFEDFDVLAYRSGDDPPDDRHALTRPHVAVVPAGLRQDLVDVWLTDQKLSRNVSMVVPHYLQALHLVGRTGLLAILPSRLIRTLGAAAGVAAKALPIPQEADRQWMFYLAPKYCP
jgi:DNA-binding transcriptional LysR family regulator